MSSALEQAYGLKLVAPEAEKVVQEWDRWLKYLSDNKIPLSGGYAPLGAAIFDLRKALNG